MATPWRIAIDPFWWTTSGLTKDEREELTRLRKEVREIRMERDILKKASALFDRYQQ